MNNKKRVYQVYDKIADWMDQHRSRELIERPYLEKLMTYLKPGASILDLGCGTGDPIARYLVEQGFDLTGVDGSQKQIAIARQRLPNTPFIIADMRTLQCDTQYDAIIAWHSFFHLTHDDQRKMFTLFDKLIKPQGVLLLTSGHEEGEVWSENGGEMLYHASLSTAEYTRLFSQNQFEVLIHKIIDKDCGDATIWLSRSTKQSA